MTPLSRSNGRGIQPSRLPLHSRPERNPFHVYLARLGAGSRPTMADALERIARIASGGTLEAEAFPWHLLRYQHVTAVRTALMESISERTGKPLGPATVNKALSALRGVLREAWRLGLMSAEDLARATDFAPVRGSTVLRGRALASHEVAALFHVCSQDPTAAGPRDAVILALGVAAGLRRAEIASLDLADLDLGRELVRVHGKGRKVREVPVKNGTLDALRAWLHVSGLRAGSPGLPGSQGRQGGASAAGTAGHPAGVREAGPARRASRSSPRTT